MRRTRRKRSSSQTFAARAGLTLLEVILAIGIFLASAAVVAQILNTGTRAAMAGRWENECAILGESKLQEFVAGIEPVEATSGEFEDSETDFRWELEVESTGEGDLLLLTMTITHTNDAGDVDAEFQMTRYMRDPQVYLDAEATAE